MNPRTDTIQVSKTADARDELCKEIAGNFPGSVYIIQDGHFVFVNPRFQEATGYSADDLLKMKPIDIVFPEDRGKVRRHAIDMLKGIAESSCEFRAVKPDGTIYWGTETLKAIDFQGRRAALGNFVDTSDSKQFAKLLEESEDKFTKVFYSTPNPMAITTVEGGKFLEVNDINAIVTGYPRLEVIGRSAVDIGLWANPEDRARMVRTLKEKRRVVNEEFLFRMKSGEIRHWLFSAEPLTIAGEECLISMATDITSLRQAEKALEESEFFNKSLLDGSPNQILVVAMDTSVKYLNKKFEEVNGYKREDVIGMKAPYPWWGYSDNVEEVKKGFLVSIAMESGGQAEVSASKENGEVYWLSIHWAQIRQNGVPKYCMITSIDITDRKKAEQQLELKMKEIEEANKKLEAIDKQKDFLINSISVSPHETEGF